MPIEVPLVRLSNVKLKRGRDSVTSLQMLFVYAFKKQKSPFVG